MNWAKGYSARYYASIVDKETMRDVGRLDLTGSLANGRFEIIGGSIKRSSTDLRESADIDCKNYNSNVEQLIRVWLDTKQGGDFGHIPLFTGIAVSPSDNYVGNRKSNSLECYSMLKLAQDVWLPRGWYAPADINCGALIKDLLKVIGMPDSYINIAENAPTLSQSIIAEENENYLSMVDKILLAIDWQLRLDGYGAIHIEPFDYDEKAIFGSTENDIIEQSITVSYDWYDAPNVLRCTLDDDYAEARDDDPNSPLSTVSRGREVWAGESDVALNVDETLAEYAQRQLQQLQRASTNVSYDRRFWPDVYPGHVIRLSYPAQNINGLYFITDQNISLGYNATTSEEVVKV